MKKLTLIRHAKSSWEFNVIDHERPLNARGFTDASKVSKELKKSWLQTDLLLSSDAIRARTTAEIFIETLKIDPKMVKLNHNLYDFSGQNLIEIIKNCDDKINDLMVFGHNHAITHMANAYGNRYIDNVPTCGVVVLEFEIAHWNQLNKGKTVKTLFPRDLKI